MPDLDDAMLERRLRGVLKEHLDAVPLDLTVETLERRREAKGARRLGRGRGITLLAAALLLVGGAVAAGSGILRLQSNVPPGPSPSLVAVATASPDATSPSPTESAEPSASPVPVAGPGGMWIQTGTMARPQVGGAVRLQDGRVLVAGGESAQLYDPATGTWSAAGADPAIGYVAVLLRDGTVFGPESVYDPASGTWTSTDPVDEWSAWGSATVTALRDGKALATKYGHALLYDPATRTWATTGMMNDDRHGAAATLLADGKVLVAGGTVDGVDGFGRQTDSAEVYDPATGSWASIANMPAPGTHLTATLLHDGKVFVAGTAPVDDGVYRRAARIYDPATGAWTELPVRPGVNFDSAALLTDGTVLVTGNDEVDKGCRTVDLFDPRTGSWTTVSGIPWCSVGSFTPLLDGTVLVTGGLDCQGDGDAHECVPNGEAALYVPAGVALPVLPDFPTTPPPDVPSPTPAPSPTPRPTPLPPAVGPVPPNARSWTVTVDNESSEPATLFVADGDDGGTFRLVGSATPNVVPAGTTMKVTFLFPAKGLDAGWITVNPRQGDGADVGFVGADDIGMQGKIWIRAGGDWGWVSP